MDIEQIKELVKAFDSSSLTELKLENDDSKIELKKNSEIVKIESISNNIETNVTTKQANEERTFVKSPIVGVAYKSPQPGEPPFVVVGQQVKKGQVLCIVEAMKMFNEIKSTFDGEIKEVLFEDSKLVEFDQPLFEIEV